VSRRSAAIYLAGICRALDALDEHLSRLGRFGSTAALTAMAAAAIVTLHVAIRTLEGLSTNSLAILNLSFEMAIVAAPIIFYARDVIAKLKTSRATLDEMSRQLIRSVEQAQAANRAKSAFLANMSHELRTPLNAIMGFSEIMEGEHLGAMNNARYLSYSGDIRASGQYLLGIINDILDLSKIEAGKMSLDNVEEFPLQQALKASLTICATQAKKFAVRLESQLPPDDVRLLAVERMIRQIVINLVSNAIKFTPAGGSVHVSTHAAPGGGFAIVVQDSGIGMTEEEIVKALTPFGQIQNKITACHSGTGLGLPLAKAMLELHDGQLEIRSVPAEGTRVTLHFPASRIKNSRVAA